MVIFTDPVKGTHVWPYGIDWLDTAITKPYFVRKQEEERAAATVGRR
jgi:hypothetical protein